MYGTLKELLGDPLDDRSAGLNGCDRIGVTVPKRDENAKKAADALARSSKWLGDYNELVAAGKHARAEKALAKSQFWLDRHNKLTGEA